MRTRGRFSIIWPKGEGSKLRQGIEMKIKLAIFVAVLSSQCLASEPETALAYDTRVSSVLAEDQYAISDIETFRKARASGKEPLWEAFKTNLSHLKRSVAADPNLLRASKVVSFCPAGTPEEQANRYLPTPPCRWLSRAEIQKLTGIKEGRRTKTIWVPAGGKADAGPM
jgi:hypothetical protein